VLYQRLTTDVPRPREFNPAISRDLEEICLKCLQPSPSDRYVTALELADDLARSLTRRPVRARPIGLLRRAARLPLRHPVYTTTLILLLGALMFSGITGRRNEAAQSRLIEVQTWSSLRQQAMQTQLRSNLARSSRYMDAVREADSERRRALPPGHYYDLACIYALAGASAQQDPDIDEDVRRVRIDRCRSAAYESLKQARAAGYFRSPDCRLQLPREAHLKFLQNEPEFVGFVESLREEQT
jgi:hypothetical protein